MNKYATKNMSFNLSEDSCPSEVFIYIFFIKVTGINFWRILEQILCVKTLRVLQDVKTSPERSCGEMFTAIYNNNFSIILIRGFEGQVATVNCSSNDDLTNSFVLATTLSAASDFLIHYSITRHIILLLLAF